VPDPTNVFAYNRYMYVLGNPLKYSDPSGHCMTRETAGLGVGRDDSDSDCWRAVDSIINVWDETSPHGYKYNYWNGIFASPEVFEDFVNLETVTEEILTPFLLNYFDYKEARDLQHVQDLTEYRQYNTSPGRDMLFDRCGLEEVDCAGNTLNALGTGSALVAAGCAYFLLAPCTMVASGVSGAAGVGGAIWTAYQVQEGNSTETDFFVVSVTLTVGMSSTPYVAAGASVFQWIWDIRSPMSETNINGN